MCAEFDALVVELKQVQAKSDLAWAELHRLMGEAHDAFEDDAEFDRLHQAMDKKQAEIDTLAKTERSIAAQMDQLVEAA